MRPNMPQTWCLAGEKICSSVPGVDSHGDSHGQAGRNLDGELTAASDRRNQGERSGPQLSGIQLLRGLAQTARGCRYCLTAGVRKQGHVPDCACVECPNRGGSLPGISSLLLDLRSGKGIAVALRESYGLRYNRSLYQR